jgi:hypothetical protein
MTVMLVSRPQAPTATTAAPSARHIDRAMAIAVARTLEMSADDLTAAMKAGLSLTDLARSKGISPDDLQPTITASLQSRFPNLSSAQLTMIASQLITHTNDHHHRDATAVAGAAPTMSPFSGRGDRANGIRLSVLL